MAEHPRGCLCNGCWPQRLRTTCVGLAAALLTGIGAALVRHPSITSRSKYARRTSAKTPTRARRSPPSVAAITETTPENMRAPVASEPEDLGGCACGARFYSHDAADEHECPLDRMADESDDVAPNPESPPPSYGGARAGTA